MSRKVILILVVIVCFILPISLVSANVTSIYLDPSFQSVGIGDTFNLDMGLNNADSTVFDKIFSWVSFDSTKLEVQDNDPVTAGIQIQVDPLGIFGFTSHRANSADNSMGKIEFEEGYSGGGTSDKSGIFARITFKSLALTASTPIDFNFNTWGFTPTTAVLRGGGDVLGSSSDHTDGIVGATVAVVPEPTSLILFGIGAIGAYLKVIKNKIHKEKGHK